ncbi:putative glutathionylspermidine synthase [Tersicoccus solisilvae]|uniref:Glutathionylspermidine synthase n=1 Tax=Tersicoccus solisilvae TaxID=1882339 RepID=A0ABQ1NNZ9_9MICC|nr:glutathionylspermidine synthase family protein [Tersicoccus solisilvae]GGC80132.1 putative glutathionylspermidine synthase [Tersicoccus solisilvae]
MERIRSTPRPDWREKTEAQGLIYSTTVMDDGTALEYWHEDAYYLFTMPEVETLEAVTEDLHRMSLEAARFLATGAMGDLGIGPAAMELARYSLQSQDPALYGRFDLAYDGTGPAKLLEYNADTPTGLVEAAICQWYWLQDVVPANDQWNGIHESLVAAWGRRRAETGLSRLHVAHVGEEDTGEDWMNAAYLLDTAQQAGWETQGINLADIGWDRDTHRFVDLDERPIEAIFKLYPWELAMADPFGMHVQDHPHAAVWFEPPWKMFLSTKALLAALWHLYPGHENLLPAYLGQAGPLTEWVAKPLHGREGENIVIHAEGIDLVQPGHYGAEGWCYQAFHPLPDFGGNRAVLGAWVVDGESVGVGVRESDGLVTDYFARFLPNVIDAPAPAPTPTAGQAIR